MGKCPHCGSKHIRRRYREHKRYKWRCRNCNRVFRAPKRGILLWLGLVVVAIIAVVIAAQQGIIPLPTVLSPLTTTFQPVSTQVADNAPKVQSTTDTKMRSPVATTSVAIAETSTPVPTPILRPHLRHIDEKQYMLELINAERRKAGAPDVELGDNFAAQLHAEIALKNCFSSHWGIDGLKPYMRYSLGGGYQSNGENGHGSDYCITSKDRYKAIESIYREISDAMEGWMGSPGHRRNILDTTHKRVNIGVAWDRYNFVSFQHFEGDYVAYSELPSITVGGILSLSGTLKNGVTFRNTRDLGVQIYYDQPPHKLTRGQVSRTYCYDGGRQVASLREPLSGNRFWTEGEFSRDYKPCPDPYDISSDASAPRSHEEAGDFWEQAHQASRSREVQTIVVPWITASGWTVSGDSFSVKANINEVLEEHGEGVYTVLVWGDIDGERAVISEYSIFHGVTLPDTYTPR